MYSDVDFNVGLFMQNKCAITDKWQIIYIQHSQTPTADAFLHSLPIASQTLSTLDKLPNMTPQDMVHAIRQESTSNSTETHVKVNWLQRHSHSLSMTFTDVTPLSVSSLRLVDDRSAQRESQMAKAKKGKNVMERCFGAAEKIKTTYTYNIF